MVGDLYQGPGQAYEGMETEFCSRLHHMFPIYLFVHALLKDLYKTPDDLLPHHCATINYSIEEKNGLHCDKRPPNETQVTPRLRAII
jgi:hypothetical protein